MYGHLKYNKVLKSHTYYDWLYPHWQIDNTTW